MTIAAWTTLALLVAMFLLLVWNKLPIWFVFILTLTAAMTLRLAPPGALFKGYSNTGVITVAALYPVAAGMYATGAISLLSERLLGLPKSVMVAQLRILVPVAVASAFLYNTPLVAMMIPAVRYFVAPQPMQLAFGRAELGSLFIAVMIGAMVSGDGQSNWYKGIQLITVYIIIALMFYLMPQLN